MLLGGNEPRLALSSSGTYYDRFYTSDSEQQAIDWLARTDANTGYRSKVISNRNVLVKMLAATGNAAPVADRLYPTLLTRDAYVFVDPQVRLGGRSTIFYTGDLITYRYPTQVLDRQDEPRLQRARHQDLQMSGVLARLRAARSDQVLVNSSLIFLTTVLMAAGGAVFWVIAARLATPEEVGLAGSLVAAADSLALFAQLGLNIAVLKTMPTSDRKAADVTTASLVVVVAGGLFALLYSVLLPVTSPRLTAVLHSPATIALYCVLVGATALNVLSDSVFLAINRVRDYLRLNGILMGVAKCTLPFALAGAGALGLYSSVGGAILLCGVASLWVIFRHVGGRPSLSPSRDLLDARRFAGASYVTYVLTVLPLLVYPLLVINALGSSAGGAYFISYQIVTLINAVILAIASSTYAESERSATGRRRIVRKGGLTLIACSSAGALAMFVLAPYFLQIFGSHYVAEGTWTLRILAFSTVAAAFNYWGAIGLRLSNNLAAMIGTQLVSTLVMLGVAVVLAPYGTEWVAASWGIGHLVGGCLGFVATHTFARYADSAPVRDEPAVVELP